MKFDNNLDEQPNRSNNSDSDDESFSFFQNDEEKESENDSESDRSNNNKSNRKNSYSGNFHSYEYENEKQMDVFFPNFEYLKEEQEEEEERFSSLFGNNKENEDFNFGNSQEESSCSSDREEMELKSHPIMIKVGNDQNLNESVEIKSFTLSISEPYNFEEFYKSDMDKELEKSFQVPSKRVPSWKLYSNYDSDY
ncbi:hypothetical protein M0813_06453 [Anaeramoeba flamelloides]|uniref:Uncharacterized protein n=1 Tax=Anaeramoeba flamelloides TaxID=1746091 RepID=A0ABQ8XFJ7_9EUKA|nr:hypothetical protein M0813_06453 [Anaeramoeba flamelloides]